MPADLDRRGPVPAAARPREPYRSLAQVSRAVVACERCPRLRAYCEAVARAKRRAFIGETYWGRPVPGLGDPRARVLIVGLAPAAHGGNRTGRAFTGDSSGDWLYAALHENGFASQAESRHRNDGLELIDCYIAAAARCAPPGNRPERHELDNCQPYLEAEIALLRRVRVVIALGRIGHERWLRAAGWWGRMGPAERPPFAHGAERLLPDGTRLISSYHPSRQNTQTGLLTRPMWRAVFRRARRVLHAEPAAERGPARGAVDSD